MTLLLQSLVPLTLLTCGAMAALPVLVNRPEPVAAEAEAAMAGSAESLRVGEDPGGRGFRKGDPTGRGAVAGMLRPTGTAQPGDY